FPLHFTASQRFQKNLRNTMQPSSNKLARDVAIVARFEAMRSIGSVRGLLVLGLYLAGSALSAMFYVKTVHVLETKAIELMSKNTVQQDGSPPDLTKSYADLAKAAAGDDTAKGELWATTPPIVLVSFCMALFFLPFFLML